MKNLLFSLFIACSTYNVASAQTNPAVNQSNISVPSEVSTRFNTAYPNVTPNWTRNGSNYRADYTDAQTNMGHSVIYGPGGDVISTDNELLYNTYPTTIGDYYTKTYPNEKYKVWSSEDKVGAKTYYINRNNETYWFDKDGKYKNKSKVTTTATPPKK